MNSLEQRKGIVDSQERFSSRRKDCFPAFHAFSATTNFLASLSRILSSPATSLNLSRSLETRYRVDSANLLRSRPTNLPTVVPPASRGSASVRELVIRRDAIKSVEKKVRKDEAARQQGGNNPEDEYAHVTDESSPIYHDETRGDTTTSPRPTINALI